MTTTDVSICNLALRNIGQATITSLSQELETARILNDIYETVRDEVLASYPWNFAIKRAILTSIGGEMTGWEASGITNVWKVALTTKPAIVKFDGTEGEDQSIAANCSEEYDWAWVSNYLYVYSTSDPVVKYPTSGVRAIIAAFDYDYAYELPSDCLRVIRLSETSAEFKIENGILLTDETNVKILYISQITDPTKFSSAFISALTSRLAAEIAYPVSNSNTLAQEKLKEYMMKLKIARSIDSQEGTQLAIEDTSWIDDRE